MGIGLLLTLGPGEGERRRRLVQKPNALGEQEEVEAAIFSPFSVLHSPPQLWVCVGLAVTLAGKSALWTAGIPTDATTGQATLTVPLASATVRLVVIASTSATSVGQAELDLTVV